MSQKCFTCSCSCILKMNYDKSVIEVKTICALDRIFFVRVLVLMLITNPASSGYVWGSQNKDWRIKNDITKIPAPEFEATNTEITSSVGRVAFLPCKVKNIADKVVSWIRTKDLHILTSGPHTFTADSRFESMNTPGSSNWGLKLRNAQFSDSGIYECQVNTDPKMNKKIHLEIVSELHMGDSPFNGIESQMSNDVIEDGLKKGSRTRILGAQEQYVKVGSTITFTCLVITPNEATSSVEWLKDGRQVSFQAARGGINVDTERAENKTKSTLTMANVKLEDSGNYTCKPSNAKAHSAVLMVLEGEQTQAVKRGHNDSGRLAADLMVFVVCVWITTRQ